MNYRMRVTYISYNLNFGLLNGSKFNMAFGPQLRCPGNEKVDSNVCVSARARPIYLIGLTLSLLIGAGMRTMYSTAIILLCNHSFLLP